QNNAWMSVPQFGGWDHKDPGATNYSMVFSQARANKKQQKTDIKRSSLGNERELMVATQQQEDSVMRKKKILTYINCCIRP
ncbi:AvrRpt-cleavage domain-containing protein, partial [Cephalotus follicularis]